MPKTRVILELGSGNDLHGSDYTKAALRAVQDALHHSSLDASFLTPASSSLTLQARIVASPTPQRASRIFT